MAEFEKIDPKNPKPESTEAEAKKAEDAAAINLPDPSKLQKRPDEPIDRSKIVDVYGNPLRYGNTDPNVIGPDDNVPKLGIEDNKIPLGQLRDRSQYSPLYPEELFLADHGYVAPMADYVARSIVDVDLIDELTYRKLLPQFKQRTICAVLDLSAPEIHDNIVTWYGFKLYCKEYEVTSVQFKLDLRLKMTITTHIRFWESARQAFVKYGDRYGMRDLTRETAVQMIDNYLAREGILA